MSKREIKPGDYCLYIHPLETKVVQTVMKLSYPTGFRDTYIPADTWKLKQEVSTLVLTSEGKEIKESLPYALEKRLYPLRDDPEETDESTDTKRGKIKIRAKDTALDG